jgi:biotin carboxyl carrier protein
MTIDVEIDGRRRVVTLEPLAGAGRDGGRFRVTVRPAGGTDDAVTVRDIDARVTGLGLSLVGIDDRRSIDAAVTERPGGETLVQLPHADIVVRVDNGRHRVGSAASERAGEQRISAPMPGRIVRVLVEPGDEVAVRQGLVVVEAMKMENELTARGAGRVREVTVVAGDSVEAGRVLVIVE